MIFILNIWSGISNYVTCRFCVSKWWQRYSRDGVMDFERIFKCRRTAINNNYKRFVAILKAIEIFFKFIIYNIYMYVSTCSRKNNWNIYSPKMVRWCISEFSCIIFIHLKTCLFTFVLLQIIQKNIKVLQIWRTTIQVLYYLALSYNLEAVYKYKYITNII